MTQINRETAIALAKEAGMAGMLDEYEGGNFKWSEEAATAREAADALQALERVPMTQAEVVDGFCKRPHNVQFVSVFSDGVRFAESHHGITPPESKG